MKCRVRKTLLVIDDEGPFCDAVRDYLESDRLEVLSAHTRKEALRVCAERKIDIVLLDQKLPDGEGHALAPLITEAHPGARIIFITAFPSFGTAADASRRGAHEYLLKPIDPEELKDIIGKFVLLLDREQAATRGDQ